MDEEGFCYPNVDLERCVECGMCEKKCPINTGNSRPLKQCASHEIDQIEAYAAFGKDMATRRQSSSGGIFPVLAKLCLELGGIVYGAAFDECWRVVHVGISCADELPRICGSKYAQRDLQGVYQEVRQMLLECLEEVKEFLSIRNIDQSMFLDLYGNSGKPVKRPDKRNICFKMVKERSVAEATAKVCHESVVRRSIVAIRKALIHLGVYEHARRLKHKLLDGFHKR